MTITDAHHNGLNVNGAEINVDEPWLGADGTYTYQATATKDRATGPQPSK